jgi:hypothetical protein
LSGDGTLIVLHSKLERDGSYKTLNVVAMVCACVWFGVGAGFAQQSLNLTSVSTPVVSETPGSIPDSPETSLGGRSRRSPFQLEYTPTLERPHAVENQTAWSRFVTDASQAGMRFAVPRLSQNGSAGLVGGSSFMGGSFATPSGYPRMGGAMRGRSATDIGSSLLQSLGDSTGGSIGSTLHTLSSLTNSRTGYALSTTGTGVDFHVSGSMGNVMGTPVSGAGQAPGSSGLGGRQSAHGPSLSLKLKF